MNEGELAQLGRIAHCAVWKTPVYRSQHADYKRQNDVLRGKSLVDALAAADFVVAKSE